MPKLTVKTIAAAKTDGRLSDGGGLFLAVSGGGSAKSWIFMWSRGTGAAKKRHSVGLGPLALVTLAEAREKAALCRRAVFERRDPRDLFKPTASERHVPTFGEVADALISSKESGWRSDKHRAQWRMALATHAAPLRSRPVNEIDTAAILAVLAPLWQSRPETASRLRGRIEAVLDAAKAQGHRAGENPATWRGHLSHLLPARSKLPRSHYAAMPYADVPAFVEQLRLRSGMTARALEFCILTATRTAETLGARVNEFDLEAGIWTIPAARMKAGKAHRVPLCDRATVLARAAIAEKEAGALLWPLAPAALLKRLRRMGVDATTHGFRSTFRDWAGDGTHFPREIIEAALAHVVGGLVEQAYRRSDALEKRRALMNSWGEHCEPNPTLLANVVRLR
jgi:integrase